MFKKHEYFFLLINLNETPCTVFDGTKTDILKKSMILPQSVHNNNVHTLLFV